MSNEQNVLKLLKKTPGMKAKEIASELGLDKRDVNSLLYCRQKAQLTQVVISQRDGKANEKNPWRLFDDYLQTAGQFADPGSVPSKPPAKITIDPTEWKNEVAAIEEGDNHY